MTHETADTPEPAPRFERFRLTYPSGTVIDAYYASGATLREAEVSHPLAVVEAVESSRTPVEPSDVSL